MTTAQQLASIEYHLEYVFSYNATLQMPPEVIGQVPEGLRVNFYVTGGEVTGPRLRGKVRPVGADWMTVGTDGVARADVRVTLESDDGALIYVTYGGLIDLGEGGYQKFLAGQLPSDGTPIRTSPHCRTGHPAYQWMNRTHFLGIGEVVISQNAVRYDIYAVR